MVILLNPIRDGRTFTSLASVQFPPSRCATPCSVYVLHPRSSATITTVAIIETTIDPIIPRRLEKKNIRCASWFIKTFDAWRTEKCSKLSRVYAKRKTDYFLSAVLTASGEDPTFFTTSLSFSADTLNFSDQYRSS